MAICYYVSFLTFLFSPILSEGVVLLVDDHGRKNEYGPHGVELISRLMGLIANDDRCDGENTFRCTFPIHDENARDLVDNSKITMEGVDIREHLRLAESSRKSTMHIFLFMTLMCAFDRDYREDFFSSVVLSNLEHFAGNVMRDGGPFSFMLYGLSDDPVSDDDDDDHVHSSPLVSLRK